MDQLNNKRVNICVYCSAREVDARYQDMVHQLGTAIAHNGYGLVYGGSRSGLMGRLADAALNAGGNVTGIIPHHIQDREIAHDDLTENIFVDTMHERKDLMFQKSEAYVVLPGGLGTIDEFIEVLTWKQLGLHTKPIIVVDQYNYWTSLIDLLSKIVAEKFASPEDLNLFKVVNDVAEVMPLCKEYMKESCQDVE